jgi:hypothetical protein
MSSTINKKNHSIQLIHIIIFSLDRTIQKKIHQRLRGQCDSREVEDEIHFLLCCSKFREERQQLFRTISQSCNNFLQLNPQENFYWLMTCEDVSVLKELSWYLPVSICRRCAEILNKTDMNINE